jgi:hypothetical protein
MADVRHWGVPAIALFMWELYLMSLFTRQTAWQHVNRSTPQRPSRRAYQTNHPLTSCGATNPNSFLCLPFLKDTAVSMVTTSASLLRSKPCEGRGMGANSIYIYIYIYYSLRNIIVSFSFTPPPVLQFIIHSLQRTWKSWMVLEYVDELHKSTTKNSVAWIRKRTIPTEWPPLLSEVSANFCGEKVPRGQCDGSLRPCSRLSRTKPLLFLPSSSSVVLTRLSGPRPRTTTSQKT